MLDSTRMTSKGEFTDDVIRRFLLGCLRDSERPAFEARLLEDDELDARVRLAELDLTDDYAFARLEAADHDLFDQNFLVTRDRRRALEISTALRHRISPATQSELNLARRLKSFFKLRQPAWQYAFAALVVILVIASVWLVTKEPQIVT